MKRFLAVLFTSLISFLALAQKPGVVKESMTCLAEPTQSYAIYLPASYKPTTPHGLVLIFDPGADGKEPVSLYQELADKYNLILACSNNSHNGPIEPSIASGNAVLEDVFSRFNIDRSFMITSGFSGGGRTAVEMAVRRGTMTGVITCGASFPSPDAIKKTKQLPFAEVIGQIDMNYQEALTANMYLKTIANPAFLVFFYGGHQWPPVEAYERALTWHLFRKKRLEVTEFFSDEMKQVKVQLDSGHLYEANRELTQLLPDFEGTKPLIEIDGQLSSIRLDKRFKTETGEVGKANSRELALQKDFNTHYNQHMANGAPDSAFHAEYWKGFRRECDKMLKDDYYKRMAGLRLIDYAWRRCSEQHFVFLDYGQYQSAAMCSKIWALLTPKWPRPCVEAAKAFALLKRKREAKEYLQMAVERGLKDKEEVLKDPAFNGL